MLLLVICVKQLVVFTSAISSSYQSTDIDIVQACILLTIAFTDSSTLRIDNFPFNDFYEVTVAEYVGNEQDVASACKAAKLI